MTKIYLIWLCIFCKKKFLTKEIEINNCCPNCNSIDFKVEIYKDKKNSLENLISV